MSFQYQSINYAIENSIGSYLTTTFNTSGSWLNQLQQSGSTITFYTGINYADISGSYPSASQNVFINCRTANEVIFNSRVYAMDVEVSCVEIAYDLMTNNIPLGQMPNYIFNEFVSSSAAAPNFCNQNINVYQVQMQGFDQSIDADAIHSKGMFKIIGGLL